LAARFWWKLFLLLLAGMYVPGGILTALSGGLGALASYLTSWGLLQSLERAHPIGFRILAGILLLLAVVSFVIDRLMGARPYRQIKEPTGAPAREEPRAAAVQTLRSVAARREVERDRSADGGPSQVEAQGSLQQALAAARQEHSRQGEGQVLITLGRLTLRRGQLEAASTYLQQALAALREVQDRRGEGEVLTALGQLALRRGQLHAAEGYFLQALALDREALNRREEGMDLTALGQLARARGRLESAEHYFQQALIIDREARNRQEEVLDLTALGQLAQARGQLDVAERYFEQALAIGREVQDRQGEGVDLWLLAWIAEARGDMGHAEAFYRQSLASAVEGQDRLGIADAKAGLGALLIGQRGQSDEGCRFLTEAAGLYDDLGLAQEADRTWMTAQQLGCAIMPPDAPIPYMRS
jgi:tetratricopeptide (TPR) repeat protein